MAEYFIGIMSGTSLDGVDLALVQFPDSGGIELIAAQTLPFPKDLDTEIRAIIVGGQPCTLLQMGSLDQRLGQLYADCVDKLLATNDIPHEQITAIGCHGQTLLHVPDSTHPFTLQIGDANRIVAQTGITTVADFRRRDMACGGQGAPLAPGFHAAMFSSPDENRVVLNIGGISNITLLTTGQAVGGFDTGPGNALLDAWHHQHNRLPFDHDGEWAAGGEINEQLIASLLADDYFARQPPKSTGKEHFNLAWLTGHLLSMKTPPSAQNVQTTLAELTARTIASSINLHGKSAKRCIVCGGGAHNSDLMRRLQKHLPDKTVVTSATLGLSPDMIEAAAFAWLAKRTLAGQSGSIHSVTGACRDTILGAIYPADK